MILGNVGDNGYVGADAAQRFELEGGYLRDGEVAEAEFFDAVYGGFAYVSACHAYLAARL